MLRAETVEAGTLDLIKGIHILHSVDPHSCYLLTQYTLNLISL